MSPDETKGGYYAIQLCGGVISPVCHSDYSDTEVLFHWNSGTDLQAYDHTFKTTELIRVGAFVTVNNTCTIDENQCWRSSAPAFEVLGVQDTVWRHDESQ